MFETAACVIYDIQAFQFLNAFQLHIVNNKLFIFSSEVNHSQEVNLSPSFTWLSVFCKCHTSLCMWTNHKLRIQFESAKFTMRGWTYSVLSKQNQSWNPEFVEFTLWYRPQDTYQCLFWHIIPHISFSSTLELIR